MLGFSSGSGSLRNRRLYLFNYVAILYVCFFLLLSCGGPAVKKEAGPLCEEKRAAWDFGSGSIKIKAAVVNVCELRLMRVLFDDSQKVNFKDDIEKSKNRSFSPASQKTAREFVMKAGVKLKELGVEKSRGVATSAFRDAQNAAEFVAQLNRDFGLNLKIIPQQEEGEWGFRAAQTRLPRQNAQVLVWDIGGGSQQLIYPEGGHVNVIESPWASVSFKNWVVQNLKNTGAVSPNPLSQAELSAAIAQAAKIGEELKPRLPRDFGKSTIQGTGAEVFGIGGVHSISVVNQTKKMSFTAEDLQKGLDRAMNKTDAQLKSPYAATDVTNLAFVLGMMRGLGLEKVHSLKVNLADGVLVYGVY